MTKVIITDDTPALDRMLEDAGFSRGMTARDQRHGIPIQCQVYLGNHGKSQNARLILSIGNRHFFFVQSNFIDFDGDYEELLDRNPRLTLNR